MIPRLLNGRVQARKTLELISIFREIKNNSVTNKWVICKVNKYTRPTHDVCSKIFSSRQNIKEKKWNSMYGNL